MMGIMQKQHRFRSNGYDRSDDPVFSGIIKAGKACLSIKKNLIPGSFSRNQVL